MYVCIRKKIESIMGNNGIIIMCLIALFFLWLFYIRIPAQMARTRGRSALGWVLLTWIISPLWSIIALLIVGDSNEKIMEDFKENLK